MIFELATQLYVYLQCRNNKVLIVKALVGAFNKKKAL